MNIDNSLLYMLKLKNLILENINSNLILECYSVLNKSKLKNDLAGGNCGMVSYAIAKFIADKHNIKSNVGVITNVNEINDMIYSDADIYHMYNIIGSIKIDETGIIDNNYLLSLAMDQYKDYNPIEFILDFPKEETTILDIVKTNTAYYISWNAFYTILQENNL